MTGGALSLMSSLRAHGSRLLPLPISWSHICLDKFILVAACAPKLLIKFRQISIEYQTMMTFTAGCPLSVASGNTLPGPRSRLQATSSEQRETL